MELIKPRRLQPGDTLAAVTLSWGGPGAIPHRYAAGKQQLEAALGVRVVEMAHTLRDPDWIARNPQARAEDLMAAFADPQIQGVVATIGGDDSIRVLPYIDLDVIAHNPKIFLGYSDSTITHLACYRAGVGSFYGPSIMAGFGENTGPFPYMVEAVRRLLFMAEAPGVLAPSVDGWTVEELDWNDPANQLRRRTLNPSTGWNWLQGRGTVRGHLLGGCLDVLDWARGTPWWPALEAWDGAILFIETSEEAPPPIYVARMLRSLAAMEILPKLAGILFGRPGGQLPVDFFREYDSAILEVVAGEAGLTELPVVTRMDFGHTDPMFVLPYGVLAEIDCRQQTFQIVEPAVTA